MSGTSQSNKLPVICVALIASVIAVFAFAALLHTPRFDPANAPASAAVKIQIYRLGGAALRRGDVLRPTDAITVNFDNPRLEGAQLALFAVDTNGAAHWFIPHESGGRRDGTSKGLPTTQGEHGILPPTQLGNVPPGPLTFVALINPGVIQLDRMDAFTPEERTPQGLRDRFPDSVVLTWPVQVVDPTAPAEPAPFAGP